VCGADNLTTLMCQLSWNLEASTSWNPGGLSRPVMGLLYLLYTHVELVHQMCNPVSLFKPDEGCCSFNWQSVRQLLLGSSRIISWKLHAAEFVSNNGIYWLHLTCTHWKATNHIEDFGGRCRGVISKNWWCW